MPLLLVVSAVWVSVLTAARPASGWLEQLGSAVAEWMNLFGGPGIAAAIAVENLFPPIPSEVVLPLAGFTAAQPDPRFSVPEAIVWATLGSVVGAWALYWVGRVLGHDRMVRIAHKLPLVDGRDVTRTVDWFARHGTKAVFFGRMLPIFRSLISIPAGIERMPQLTFLLLTTAGSAIWNTLFVIAGFVLGERWETVLSYSSVFEKVVLVAIVALLGVWILNKLRKRRQSAADSV